jgi:DNA-binding MarR family transcriptional regulator
VAGIEAEESDASDTAEVSDSQRMAVALRLVAGRITRRLRQTHAVGEMTSSEVSVLARLDHDGAASPGVLAEQERVRPQAMASTLATLEERGLVRREPDPDDGRRAVMTVTTAGHQMLLDRRSESTQRLTSVLDAEFTAAERRTLLAVLPLLDRLAERL